MIGEAVVLAVLDDNSPFSLDALAIFFLYGHIAFYSSCIDATTYINVAEIFPTHLRAIGISFSLTGLFLASLTFTQAATSAFAAIGWQYYIVFIVTSSLMVAALWFVFPETKGLSLEETSTMFGDPVAASPADSGKDEKTAQDHEEAV